MVDTHKIKSFFQTGTAFQAKDGDILIASYEQPTDVFYLDSGIVKQTITTDSGKEHCLTLYKPGSFFPLIGALAHLPNEYSFSPVDAVSGWKMPITKVRAYILENPDVLLDLNVRLLKGLHGFLKKTEKLMDGDAGALLLQTLITLSQRFPDEHSSSTITIPFTHQQLAGLTGLSRETVTRELANLKKDGHITVDHHHITLSSLSTTQASIIKA